MKSFQQIIVLSLILLLIDFVNADLQNLSPWPIPQKNTKILTFDSSKDFEPSGITYLGGYIYIVSDNGKIARVKVEKNNQKDIDYQNISHELVGDNDFEAITTVKGVNALFLGIEGGRKNNSPIIFEYFPIETDNGRLPKNAKKKNIGRNWILPNLPILGSNNGMEAMTFIPDGKHQFPYSQGGFDGLFFCGSQGDIGSVYAYDLSVNGDAVALVGVIKNVFLKSAALSDLHYSEVRDTLFALYDENIFQMQELRMQEPLNGQGGNIRQVFLAQPLYNAKKIQGIEGLTTYNSELFISIDQKRKQGKKNSNYNKKRKSFDNYIYRYLLYPKH
ncbi:hypothetical protein [Candidatus Uabimicrobium sp. HlEnr_7]|uniref:hypothetical protein n=1 Tax=Candidatus Uabimicrobium helgolandensis TaxID=3095367 RepID=UPI00355706E9